MIPYQNEPDFVLESNSHAIHVFAKNENDKNIDNAVVNSFGDEWSKFNSFSDAEIEHLGRSYFDILDDQMINAESNIIDFGAGTGRFSKYLSDRVKFIDVLEPSNAVFSASYLLRDVKNIRIAKSSIGASPFEDEAYDFAMSIGVLHHMPDTLKGLQQCVKKVKSKGWFYVYLYYDLEDRGLLFKGLFAFVNFLRLGISRLPSGIKNITCDFISLTFYWPVIATGRFFRFMGWTRIAQLLPLSYYQDKSFHIIRNDALDRFGTRLEKRFSKDQVINMMLSSGLSNIRISSVPPFWRAVGQKD